MGFLQIVDFRTDNIDEMRKMDEEWEAAAKSTDGLTARRGILCADRDNPGRYLQIIFFDSYESAMENSEHPVTQEFAQKMGAAVGSEPTFVNLDVLDDRTYSG